MSTWRAWLTSPIAPATLLLFGLTFGFAISHIVGLSWTPVATRVYYLGIFLWGSILIVQRRKRFGRLGMTDSLFLAFLFLVIASLAVQYDGGAAAAYYLKLLPFLLLLPYGLGRLIEADDFERLWGILPWLGLLLLLLCPLDYWLVPDNGIVYSRWRFFGVNHSPLLIALLVSVATLALAHRLARPDVLAQGWRSAAKWAALGVLPAGLVLIAARGALIACAISLGLTILLVRIGWSRKLALLGYVVATIAVTFYTLPAPQAAFYARASEFSDERSFLSSTLPEHAELLAKIKENPDCKPLIEGVNSVSIRRLLYTEAIDLFLKHPLTGVGATRFGNYSCGGLGAYPHSTVLQAFAELGVFGGTALLALFAVSFFNVARIYAQAKRQAGEAVFCMAMIAFFALTDQIYGNYFMAAGSFFIFGVASSFHTRSNAA